MTPTELYNQRLDQSLDIIFKWARRGMITGQIKDKFSSTRWYAEFTYDLSLHSLLYPRRYYNRFPEWLNTLDHYFFIPLFKYSRVNKLFNKWQIYCYKQCYYELQHKFPDIQHAIDHQELL